jgi:inner membrane protein
MPSSIAHGFTALALGAGLLPRPLPRRVAITGIACAVLLDLDAIGRPFGRGDVAWLGGHRALTHSVFFALAVGGLLTLLLKGGQGPVARWRVFAFLTSAMLAHGILDMFTDDHPAVAIFAPVSWERFRAPWQPFQRIWMEVLIVWIPCWLFVRYRSRTRLP